ncbi:MAG: methionine adenosyltransferase domain-containing protein, partial [Oscillospiraceae bacterium]|nr:methionine adenosyltransferase domain-containing protein [Oscillospiraceae bacterium]
VFSLTPDGIIQMLDLRKPQYRKVAAYGHFGRENLNVAWERTDKVQALLDAVK